MFELHVPNARERLKHEIIIPTVIMDWVLEQPKPFHFVTRLVNLILAMTDWVEKEPSIFEGHFEFTTTFLSMEMGISER